MSKRVDILRGCIAGIAIVAQLFLLAPLYVYVTNYQEFSLSAHQILKILIPVTIFATIVVCIAIYFMIRSKRDVLFSIVTGFAIYLYLQFYFFVWDYGIFDGSEINFGTMYGIFFVELFAFILLLVTSILYSKKFTLYGQIFLVAVFVGQIAIIGINYFQIDIIERVALLEAPDSDFFHASASHVSNANSLSSKKNIIVILIDTLQSDFFERIIERNNSIKEALDGFVFFRNSAGLFPYTSLTIPAVLSGKVYKPNQNIREYTELAAKHRIGRILNNQGFNVSSIPLHNRVKYLNSTSQKRYEIANLLDVALFRQVPHVLKPVVYNKGGFLLRRFLASKVPSSDPEIDLAVLKSLIENTAVDNDKPHFKFMHFWGMHPPARLNRDCEAHEPSNKRKAVEEQAECVLNKVAKYLDKIKGLEVYDRSQIFIIADTGSKYEIQKKSSLEKSDIPDFIVSSAHPVIAAKNFYTRGGLTARNSPVNLIDVPKTILTEQNIDTSKLEGFDVFSVKEDQERIRHFYYYKGSEEARLDEIPQIQEFIINGFIRDISSWDLGEMYLSDQVSKEIMSLVDFGQKESAKFADLGWSVEAAGHRISWTVLEKAALLGRLPDKKRIKLIVKFANPHINQTVEVLINGRLISKWNIDKPTNYREYTSEFDLVKNDSNGIARIDFRTKKIGIVNDRDVRELGIAVDWVKFE